MQEAEDNYYIAAEYVLKLANKAYDLFKSSEIEERRQLIKLVLQNPKVVEKNIVFDLQKPFDTIFKYANRSSMLPCWDTTRIEKWVKDYLMLAKWNDFKTLD